MKKNVLFVFLVILMIVQVGMSALNYVYAADTPSLEVKIQPDTSEVLTNKKVYFNISFINVKNIDQSKAMALIGTLEYNDSILKNPTINGGKNWSVAFNNNKVLLDCMSFKENETIATIVFDVNATNSSNVSTKIALTSVNISNSVNYDATIQRIESLEATIVTSQQSQSTGSFSDNSKIGNEVKQNLVNTGSETIKDSSTKSGASDDTSSRGFNLVLGNNTNGSSSGNAGNSSYGGGNNVGSSSGNSIQQKVNTIEPVKDATTSNSPIPQTGVGYGIIIAIVIIVVIGIYTFIRDKKFYD